MNYKNKNFTDTQLVEYISKNISEIEEKLINEALVNDNELAKRVSFWEQALFELNAETKPIEPPKSVWQNIEKGLFDKQTSNEQISDKQNGFFAGLLSWKSLTFVTTLAFATVFFFMQQGANYKAVIVDKGQVLWEIEADSNSILVTSLKNVEMVDMDCVVWVKKANGKLVRIGRIPDSGHNATIKLKIAKGIKIQLEDKIIVAMVGEGYSGKELPENGQYKQSGFKQI